MLSAAAAKAIAEGKFKTYTAADMRDAGTFFIVGLSDGSKGPGGSFCVSVDKNSGECEFFDWLGEKELKIFLASPKVA